MRACIPGVKGGKKLRVMDTMPIDLIIPMHSVVVTFVFIVWIFLLLGICCLVSDLSGLD